MHGKKPLIIAEHVTQSVAAVEICDAGEIDENCNGEVNEGSVYQWYDDADGDGYGDSGDTSAVIGCTNPGTGFSATRDDCDDGDSCRVGDGRSLGVDRAL